MLRNLISFLALVGIASASGPAMRPQRLDARFVSDRVIVSLATEGGGKLHFYTDTGGGGTLLYAAAAERLKLETGPLTGAAAKDFPPSFRQLVGQLSVTGAPQPPLPVYVAPDFIAAMGGPIEADGLLGNSWFAGRIWTWDYPRQSLTAEDNGWAPPPNTSVIPVTFRRSVAGKPAPMFPRIVVRLAGEPTSVLLDTGAETLLSSAAVKAVGEGPALRATSMIASSRFHAWHAAHPDWTMIEGAQVKTGARMIRVPDVVIAGFQVGPVWFTERPDANFHSMMSSSMDAQIEGAIGGNAFKTLRMTVDYRAGRAAFVRP